MKLRSFVVTLLAAVAPVSPPKAATAQEPATSPADLEPARSNAPAVTPGDMADRMERMTRDEGELKRQLQAASQNAQRAHELAIRQARVYVRMARAGLLPVGAGIDALASHAARIERLHAALARSVATERHENQRRIALSGELERLQASKNAFASHGQPFDAARTALVSERDRELAFQRAFSQSAPLSYTSVYGATGPIDPDELARGLSAMKGRLPFPVPGRTEIRSLRLPGADGPGLELRASRGTAVRAVYPGRVGFADTYGVYGLAVIIDHGESHYTVCGNLGALEVRAGDTVSTGTRLGTVGRIEGGWGLYFEVRVGTETADAAEWFGI
jgi:septal ring factor EnvC (AmiA/AmiB activator)